MGIAGMSLHQKEEKRTLLLLFLGLQLLSGHMCVCVCLCPCVPVCFGTLSAGHLEQFLNNLSGVIKTSTTNVLCF